MPQRSYDVTRFVGDPGRARALLGWQASTEVVEGVRRLVHDFAKLQAGVATAAIAEEAPLTAAARAAAQPT
jgi:hypothetical protein